MISGTKRSWMNFGGIDMSDIDWRKRPRKKKEDKLNKSITVRVKDKTYKTIETKAEKEKKTIATYIRKVLEENNV